MKSLLSIFLCFFSISIFILRFFVKDASEFLFEGLGETDIIFDFLFAYNVVDGSLFGDFNDCFKRFMSC